jgi:uncharacterized membrane protein
MWTPDSGHAGRYKSTLLPHRPGGVSKVNGVFGTQANKIGRVAGWVTTSIIGQLGALWNNDAAHAVVDLGILPGETVSVARGVNHAGQVVGQILAIGVQNGRQAAILLTPIR